MNGIALIGEPGSGKTSIAQALATKLGWKHESFARALKDEVATILAGTVIPTSDNGEFIDEYLRIRIEMNDVATKDYYRPLLQWWGTEWRRAKNQHYWVNKLGAALIDRNNYIIDDCRFDNEWEMLQGHNFKLVLLEPGETTRPVQAHKSEVDWKEWSPDLTLTYEAGPDHQADRILKALQLVMS